MRTILYKASRWLFWAGMILLVLALFTWQLIYGFFICIISSCICDIIAERMGRR